MIPPEISSECQVRKKQTSGTSQVIGGAEITPYLGLVKCVCVSDILAMLDILATILRSWWGEGD